MPRWRARGLAVIVVGITASIAWSGGGGDAQSLTIHPKIVGIRHQVGSSGFGTVMVSNAGSVFDGRIVATNCGGIAHSPSDPFSVPAMGSTPVMVQCPGTLSPGMHRCTFDIQNGSNQSVATFLGFCVTHTQQVVTVDPPSPIAFINQQIGVESTPRTLELSNPTALTIDPMQLQVDNPSFLVGSPCQNELGCDSGQLLAGSAALVDVLCKPLTAGLHTGKLFVIGENGIALTAPVDLSCMTGSGSGSAVLTIDPPNVMVQPTEINNQSTSSSVALRNAGSAGTISITGLDIQDNGAFGAANDWSFTVDGECVTPACMLGPGDQLDVRLTFDPSSFNARPARLIIDYTDPGIKQASVSLDGAGLGATAELVGAPSLEFGVVPIGVVSGSQTFKVRNQGNRSTSLSVSAVPEDPFIFPMDVPMPPGETDVFVTCSASSEIDASANLAMTGSDAVGTLTVPMHCEVRNTQITTTPTSVALGEVRVTTSVPAETIQIDRVGSGSPIGLTSAVLATTPDPNLTLGGLANLTTPSSVSLMIDPATEGPIANSVTITPAAGEALQVPVVGSVVRAELSADDVMTLGTFCVGQPTTGTTVSLRSLGTATIVVDDVDLDLGVDSPYEIERTLPSTYPASLAPLIGEASVLVTPKRSDTPDDQVMDTLEWDTDAGLVTSKLTTRFIADGGAIAPDELDFGDVEIRIVNDDAQGITLQNCSTDPLQLAEAVVPPPFALTGELPTLLDPAARATISILFLPTEVGEVTRSLTIETMGGESFAVTLRGTGITGEGGGGSGVDDGKLDETSFYACGCRSSTDPSGVLAIALGLGWAVRRRRTR